MDIPATAPRSYLFVPGDRLERFDKAWASAADAVIVDLEDAAGLPRMSGCNHHGGLRGELLRERLANLRRSCPRQWPRGGH